MATEFSNIDFKFRYGTREAMNNTEILNGSFNICTDTGDIYIDINNNRLCSSDIISGYTEEEVRALKNPGTNIYYTSDTYQLMMYDTINLQWISFGKTVEQAKKDGNGNVITDTYATISALNALNSIVSNLNSFEIVVLTAASDLPEVGAAHTIYFVPATNTETENIYEEYIYITSSSSYEKIGASTADLSAYYTSAQTDSAISTAINDAKAIAASLYIKELAVSGTTITYTKGDGTTGTITTQDTTYTTGTATSSGLTKLYTGTGSNTDGTINQSQLTTLLNGKLSTTGNAATASALANARTINGTSFNGTANITTANWGTSRAITIQDADGTNISNEVGVDGSSAASLKLPATIKADLTGNATTSTGLKTARTIALSGGATGTATSFNGSANISIPVTSLDATKLLGTASISTTGNAGTATKLATARTIALSGAATSTATAFDGSANITIPVTSIDATKLIGGISTDTTGNAATATALATARNINGTSFDGTADITTANWGTSRNIVISDADSTNTSAKVIVNGSADTTLLLPSTIKANITGNATTATTWKTARTISLSGAAKGSPTVIDGSIDITIPVTSLDATKLSGNIAADTSGNAATATTLQTARTIGLSGGATGTATSFDGSANISIPVTSIDATKLSGTASINTTGNASTATTTTGNAATATTLQTARTIALSGGATGTATSFDGSVNITIPITSLDATKLSGIIAADTSGNAATATTLQTARTIALSGGATGTATIFDGSVNITIPITSLDASMLNGEIDCGNEDE